jgi:hypothetical protein
MQIILMRRVMIVSFTNPTAVELSVWMGDLGCGQPISASVLRMGTMSRAVMYKAASSVCRRGHAKFDDLRNGEDGSVDSQYGFIFGEEDVGSGVAA